MESSDRTAHILVMTTIPHTSTSDRNNAELSMHTKKSPETETTTLSLMDYTDIISWFDYHTIII